MNHEAWDLDVLLVVGRFGVLLYVALIYADFLSSCRVHQKGSQNRRNTGSRITPRRLRTRRFQGIEQNSSIMNDSIRVNKRAVAAGVTVAIIVIAAAVFLSGRGQSSTEAARGNTFISKPSQSNATLDLSPSQLNSIKIEQVETYGFAVEKDAVGNISYADDLSVDIFPPYQGTIIKALVELGTRVQKEQPLYTIRSPDLIQAESTLIGAAATYELTTKELARAKDLYTTNVGIPQKELEQAISDQQTAEGALKAARDAVLVFGRTNTEIDQIIASRKIDPALVVRSPMAGKVTAFNAPAGLLVQPGSPPAPYSVANVTVKWMLANVPEGESASYHLGQPVEVRVMAYPDRVFKGKVSKIYEAVDPNTHRVTIRSEIADPRNELRPGMLANFVIAVDGPVLATAMAANGVVREPDGTMVAWVTTDRRHFVQKVVKTGLRQNGRVEIIEGLGRGDLVVSDGAVFLSNMLEAPPSD